MSAVPTVLIACDNDYTVILHGVDACEAAGLTVYYPEKDADEDGVPVCDVSDPDSAICWGIEDARGEMTDDASAVEEDYYSSSDCDTSGPDCDDGNSSVHPAYEDVEAADEQCNGVDDDCDGTPDDGLDEVYFADADGDGYGDADAAEASCDPEASQVSNAEDCDDADSTVNPAASEECDGIDNDCDGSTDEDDAQGAFTWYADGDADGYGWEYTTISACIQPAGYIADSSDCNDGDVDVNPAADEACNAVDDNCDGVIDIDTSTGLYCLTEATTDLTGVWTGDSAGYAVATGDVTGDGSDDLVVGAPSGGRRTATGAGEVYLLHGGLSAGSVNLADAESIFTGESTNWQAGISLCVGDVTGSGAAEIVVGATQDTTGGPNSGAVYVVSNPDAGESSLGDAWAKWTGVDGYDEAGVSVACADFDGDGYADVLVGASGAGSGSTGSAYLVAGLVTGESSLSSSHATLEGVTAGSGTGLAVGADVDASGDPVALVLARGVGAYLVTSPAGTVPLSLADAILDAGGGFTGNGLATGDLDNDGHFDVLLGDYDDDTNGIDAGVVYAAFGPFAGTHDVTAGPRWYGDGGASHRGAGIRIAVADADADGIDDALIGATDANSDPGHAYLLLGYSGLDGVLSVDLADADYTFVGESVEAAGHSVAFGSFDTDTDDQDVVIGADYGGSSSEGAVYVLDVF